MIGLALQAKYPDVYPPTVDPVGLGYTINTPPAYHDGTLFVGTALSENHIPGGLVIASDATTGAIKWVFNTIPQRPQDDGWEIANETWGDGQRAGGGVWTQPAIDLDLGLLYDRRTDQPNSRDGRPNRHGRAGGGGLPNPADFVQRVGRSVSITVNPLGDSLRPGPHGGGHSDNYKELSRVPSYPKTTSVSAYNPASGELVWQQVLPALTPIAASGNLVTAGDVVFQGTDDGGFYAFHAATGEQLFRHAARRPIKSSPLTYEVNGTVFVAVIATNTVLTFALGPDMPGK